MELSIRLEDTVESLPSSFQLVSPHSNCAGNAENSRGFRQLSKRLIEHRSGVCVGIVVVWKLAAAGGREAVS